MSETISSAVFSKQINSEQNKGHTAMTESNLDAPPDQNSPKNIMNILNDDCLQSIFLKIDKFQDFYTVSKVCTRFQKNAIICFPFKKIQIGYRHVSGLDENEKFKLSERSIDSTYLESFLSIFGSRLESIECYFRSKSQDFRPKLDHVTIAENLDLISKYCGNTLNKLWISVSWEKHDWNLLSPFQILKT